MLAENFEFVNDGNELVRAVIHNPDMVILLHRSKCEDFGGFWRNWVF
jgi:hypothetical protein